MLLFHKKNSTLLRSQYILKAFDTGFQIHTPNTVHEYLICQMQYYWILLPLLNFANLIWKMVSYYIDLICILNNK